MMQTVIFGPIMGLGILTALVSLRLIIIRVGGSFKKPGDPDFYDITSRTPPSTKAVNTANNLGNLFEFPVLFYLVCTLSYLTSAVDYLQIYLAWGYVASRIIHSAIHVTYNKVPHRFGVFLISNLVLLAMWIRFGMGL